MKKNHIFSPNRDRIRRRKGAHHKRIDAIRLASFLSNQAIPVYLFGNVMPDPDFFALIEDCGIQVIGNDFCTSTRMFEKIPVTDQADIFGELSQNILKKPPCARTFDPSLPGKIADDVIEKAKSLGAHGVIGHSLKFCDPYLARLPMVREAIQKTEIPLLLLEGDCTLRSFGQQKTRIEAFVEMLR